MCKDGKAGQVEAHFSHRLVIVTITINIAISSSTHIPRDNTQYFAGIASRNIFPPNRFVPGSIVLKFDA